MTCLQSPIVPFRRLWLTLGILIVLAPGVQAQPAARGIALGPESIRIVDEDDDLNNDEPYLIVTRFEFRVRTDASGRITLVPGTLQVANIMSGHNNLRSQDNWADEGRTYRFVPPRYAQKLIPWNEEGWVIGLVITHMEEDGFSAATAQRLSEEIRRYVERSLTAMTPASVDGRDISRSLTRQVSRQLARDLERFNIAGIIRGLASVVDPDDYGGTQLVMAVTGPDKRVYLYVGLPTTDEATFAAGWRELRNGTHTVSLKFPAGALGNIPRNARFCGDHRVNVGIRVWEETTRR